jgi:hypothetical protein
MRAKPNIDGSLLSDEEKKEKLFDLFKELFAL